MKVILWVSQFYCWDNFVIGNNFDLTFKQVIGLSCLVGLVQSKTISIRNDDDEEDNDQIVGGTPAASGEFPYQVNKL